MEFSIGLIKSNRDSNTNKFYIITREKNIVTVKWGRIGAEAREQVYLKETNNLAMDFAVKKMNEKLKKGYSEYPIDKILKFSKDDFIDNI